MDNCIVKQLMGTVDNNNIPILGAITLGANQTEKVKIEFRGSDFGSRIIDLDGNFRNLDDTEDIGNIIVVSTSNNGCLVPVGHRVRIENKYIITSFSCTSNSLVFPISDIEYMGGLVALQAAFKGSLTKNCTTITDFGLVGDMSKASVYNILSHLPNVRNLTVLGVTPKPKISNIACLTNLVYLTWVGMSAGVPAHLEDYVAECIRLGRTSGSTELMWSDGITFHRESAYVTYPGKILSWSPNSQEPSITEVTYGDVTVTYDGTNWRYNGNIYTP